MKRLDRLLRLAPWLLPGVAVLTAGMFILGASIDGSSGRTACGLWAAVNAAEALGLGLLIRRLHGEWSFDSVTGLHTRRSLQNAIRPPGALILIDVDHFKRINDRHGHGAGDAVLHQVGVAIQTAIRPDDLAGRWGGDEFVVWLPGADELVAGEVAERIRRRVAAMERFGDGYPLTVTISAGVAAAGSTPERLLALADRALYSAKVRRNSVSVGTADAESR